jgi:hypothetical protein
MSDSKSSHLPPPTRSSPSTPVSATTTEPAATGWKGKMKGFGKVAVDKAVVASDWAGHKLNYVADKVSPGPFVSENLPG